MRGAWVRGWHASASPFEGFAERTNWLKDAYSFASDPFGKLLLDAGIPEATLKEWSVDPQVVLPGSDKKGSLFDAVETWTSRSASRSLSRSTPRSPSRCRRAAAAALRGADCGRCRMCM